MELKATLCYCPHCGDWYRVRPFLVGSSSNCRKCGKAFTLTAAPDQKTFQRKTLLLLKRLSLLLYPAMLIMWFFQKTAWPLLILSALVLFHVWCIASVRYATTADQMATRKQLPVFLRFGWTVLLILLFGASIAFYATPWKLLCLQALQFLALALPASIALDAGWSLARVAKAPHRTRDLLTGASTIIASFLPFAAIAASIWLGRLPSGFWPWLLPLAVIVLPFLINAAHRALLESQSSRALIKHVAIAVIAAGLTWLQITLAHSLHTWFFVGIGILPIPLLGVTTLITLVAAVFSATVLVSAGIFHPLRKMYGIR